MYLVFVISDNKTLYLFMSPNQSFSFVRWLLVFFVGLIDGLINQNNNNNKKLPNNKCTLSLFIIIIIVIIIYFHFYGPGLFCLSSFRFSRVSRASVTMLRRRRSQSDLCPFFGLEICFSPE